MTAATDTLPSPRSRALPFDAFVLNRVIAEMRPQIIEGLVQDVRQPTHQSIQLRIHARGHSHLLLICLDAKWFRMHLSAARLPNAQTPFSFCTALRRHIEGRKLSSIEQIGFDRFVKLTFIPTSSAQSDAGDNDDIAGERYLYLELMGKHSNAILTDQNNRIIDSARRVSHRINRVRETLPGLPYLFPPGIDASALPAPRQFATDVMHALSGNLTTHNTASIAKAIRAASPTIPPFLAEEMALQASGGDPSDQRCWISHLMEPEDALCALFEVYSGSVSSAIETISPAGVSAYPMPLFSLAAASQRSTASLNAAIDRGTALSIKQEAASQSTSRLFADMQAELAHLQRTAESMLQTAAEGSRADEYNRSADLIFAFLGRIPEGASVAVVPDLYDSEQKDTQINLDPQLTPQQNATAYMEKAKLARDRQKRAEARLDALMPRIEKFEEAKQKATLQLEGPDATAKMADAIREELTSAGLLRRPALIHASGENPFAGHKIRRLHSPQGYEVLLGETATANDYLTQRIAASGDIWMHVRASTSAHVVIRTSGKPELLPHSVVLWAAGLCAQHSDQKHSSLVAVDYTQKRYVRKPRGSKVGFVLYTHEKTVHVAPEDQL